MSDTSPPTSAEIYVAAKHPHWSGVLCFDEAAGRARLAANDARASYSAVPGGVLLLWDDFPAEHFSAVDGCLVHASLVADPGPTPAEAAPSVIRVKAPGAGICVALRWPGEDAAAFRRVFQTRDRDVPPLPRTASTVVDLGAGIGLTSLSLAHRYPDARVYSVSLDVADHDLLAHNLAQLGDRCAAAGATDAAIDPDRVGGHARSGWGGLIRQLGLSRIDVLRIDATARDGLARDDDDAGWLDAVGVVVVDVAPDVDVAPEGCGGGDAISRLLQARGFTPPLRSGAVDVFARSAAGRTSAAAVGPSRRTIVVTPYFKEDAATLRRCIESVRGQSQATEHLLVADGHPQPWIDDMPVRHLRLDRSHGDYGNTPRGMGSLLAISEDYDAIAFLDADNWLEPDHVERCYAAADAAADTDYVVARWNLRRPDESIIQIASQPGHVDTNCFFLLPGSYHLIPHFSMMPRELSPIGDRVFYAAVQAAGLTAVETDRATVNYTCLWASTYGAIGEEPPPGAKPNIDSGAIEAWLKGRTPRALDIVGRRSGVRVA